VSAPVNGATGISLTPTLTWGTVPATATYRVQVSTRSTFTSLVLDDSALTAASVAITITLSGSTTYYWRVDAKNALGTSPWSSAWSFTTTTGGPSVPLPTSPSNGATDANPGLLWLIWEGGPSGAISYHVQLSTSNTFATTVLDSAAVTANSVPVSGLAINTTYYWRVNVTTSAGTSAWSTVFSFTTISSAPGAPSVVNSPANGDTGISLTPVLTWGTIPGTATYRVQVSTSNTFYKPRA
jgi:hypothetical protein